VTFDNGDVTQCKKLTGKKQTPDGIEHRKTHRRSGRHIVKEVDVHVAKDKDKAEHLKQRAKDPVEHNLEAWLQPEISGKTASRTDEDKHFLQSQCAAATVESTDGPGI
jgi:ABC-type Zn2+ transport system substrate-binding protein/surface adhesin